MSNSTEEAMLKDGLIDAYNNYHKGITAENVAEKWSISRKEQDNFSFESQNKTQQAIKNKKFKEEVISNFLDEHPRSNVTIKSLSELKLTKEMELLQLEIHQELMMERQQYF